MWWVSAAPGLIILACEQACSGGFLVIDTDHELCGSFKSLKMSYLVLNLFNLTLERYKSFNCQLLKTRLVVSTNFNLQTSLLGSVSTKHPSQNQLPPGTHKASADTQQPMKMQKFILFLNFSLKGHSQSKKSIKLMSPESSLALPH